MSDDQVISREVLIRAAEASDARRESDNVRKLVAARARTSYAEGAEMRRQARRDTQIIKLAMMLRRIYLNDVAAGRRVDDRGPDHNWTSVAESIYNRHIGG